MNSCNTVIFLATTIICSLSTLNCEALNINSTHGIQIVVVDYCNISATMCITICIFVDLNFPHSPDWRDNHQLLMPLLPCFLDLLRIL